MEKSICVCLNFNLLLRFFKIECFCKDRCIITRFRDFFGTQGLKFWIQPEMLKNIVNYCLQNENPKNLDHLTRQLIISIK